jgi:hypothetical protein
MPNPTSIRAEAVRIRAACSQVTVIEHVPLNRTTNRMYGRSDMRYGPMNRCAMACDTMPCNTMSCNAMRMDRCSTRAIALIARLLGLN